MNDRTRSGSGGGPTAAVVIPRLDGVMSTVVPTIEAFRGLRYARAERFEAPVDVAGVEQSSTAACPQVPGTLETLLGSADLATAEDCLFLDVYTPGRDGVRRPVLVWIHGGAFVNGSGSMPWYDGAGLAALGDVVVVTINYRLGAFGFTGGTDLGLADQLAALRWVKREIAAFGGDPDDVTVFGESAGGCSVLALMSSPASTGLFRRSWAMSPSIPQIRTVERAAEMAARLTEELGTDPRHATVERLLEAQMRCLAVPGDMLTAFAPTAGGSLVPADWSAAVAADGRPLVIGTTRDEMALFTAFDATNVAVGPAELEAAARRRFADRAGEAIDVYRRHRPGFTAGQLVSAIQTDETFRVPAWRLAARRVASVESTWMYWFTYPTPVFGGALGACHGLDIPYAFANLEQPGVTMFTGDSPDRWMVARHVAGALVAFARSGDPGWTPFDIDRRMTLRFDTDRVEISDPEPEIRQLWETGD